MRRQESIVSTSEKVTVKAVSLLTIITLGKESALTLKRKYSFSGLVISRQALVLVIILSLFMLMLSHTS